MRKGRTIVATVIDGGVGFDPAAKTRSEFPQFGLTTMRERAASVGGNITVESARGRGTTVRFELPLGEVA